MTLSASDGSASAPPTLPLQRSGNRRTLLFGLLVCVGVLAGLLYVVVPGRYEVSTDDAYVDAHLIAIIPKVPAYVRGLAIDDNSAVAAGDLLIQLDDRDYAIAVEQARADLAVADGKREEARHRIAAADATVRQDQAELDVAKANATLAADDLRRLRSVSDIRAVSTERVDTAKATAAKTRAAAIAAGVKIEGDAAGAELARAEASTAEASVAKARALLDRAQLDVSYTRIYAPDTGTVANRLVEAGNFVQPGQKLLTIVPRQIYVIANYKETQLTLVRPGQQAVISVDAFPGLKLHGHVDSVQRGTGSVFALLPPENATGNFVKVVQRLPVKIVLDDPGDALRWIVPGMSVETRIAVATAPSWLPGFD